MKFVFFNKQKKQKTNKYFTRAEKKMTDKNLNIITDNRKKAKKKKNIIGLLSSFEYIAKIFIFLYSFGFLRQIIIDVRYN